MSTETLSTTALRTSPPGGATLVTHALGEVPSTRRKLLFALLLAAATAGVAVACVLVQEHFNVYSGGVSDALFCGAGGRWDCNQVAAHHASWLAGYPLAFLGLLYYVFVLMLAVAAALGRGADRKAYLALGTVVTTLALAFDLYLGFIMVRRIGSVCLNCVATYALNAVLVYSFASLDRSLRVPVKWSKLCPSWRALRSSDDASYYRNLVKAGLCALAITFMSAIYLLVVSAYNRVTAEGSRQIEELLGSVLWSPPEIEMSRFDGQPSIGPADARVTVVVAGDFQCTYCRSLANSLDRCREQWPKSVRLIYVHSPLSSQCNPDMTQDLHPDACWLAQAGECAAAQGKFWEYHRYLTRELPQGSVGRAAVLGSLGEIGLDADAFSACMSSDAPSAAVRADVALCKELGLTKTPALVINGHRKLGGLFPTMVWDLIGSLIPPDIAPAATPGDANPPLRGDPPAK